MFLIKDIVCTSSPAAGRQRTGPPPRPHGDRQAAHAAGVHGEGDGLPEGGAGHHGEGPAARAGARAQQGRNNENRFSLNFHLLPLY